MIYIAVGMEGKIIRKKGSLYTSTLEEGTVVILESPLAHSSFFLLSFVGSLVSFWGLRFWGLVSI